MPVSYDLNEGAVTLDSPVGASLAREGGLEAGHIWTSSDAVLPQSHEGKLVRSWPSLIIGFFVPMSLILGGVLVFGPMNVTLAGFPIVFIWLFMCTVFSSLCMGITWHFFDKKFYAEND